MKESMFLTRNININNLTKKQLIVSFRLEYLNLISDVLHH